MPNNNPSADQEPIEPKVTRAQVLAFYKEQLSVKRLQAELQKLNTSIAVDRVEEVKAIHTYAEMKAGQLAAQSDVDFKKTSAKNPNEDSE